jgi:hypothetical protein
MKIRLDLTKTNRFAIWESGGWDSSKKNRNSIFGTSVIIAGPEGERLKIAFDTNPRENITQCAFFAEIGQIVAACYVELPPEVNDNSQERLISLELARIQQLTTDLIQGEARAIPKLQTLWVHRQPVSLKDALHVADSYDLTKEGHKEDYRNLLRVSIEKAITPLNSQRFFWAIPRTT